jgi:hypothetical protein
MYIPVSQADLTSFSFEALNLFLTAKNILDLFQRSVFGFRQNESCGDVVNHGASSEYEEHYGVAVFADGGEEYGRNEGCYALVHHQREAHTG